MTKARRKPSATAPADPPLPAAEGPAWLGEKDGARAEPLDAATFFAGIAPPSTAPRLNGHAPAAPSVDLALADARTAIEQALERDDPGHKWGNAEPEHRDRIVENHLEQQIHFIPHVLAAGYSGVASLLAAAMELQLQAERAAAQRTDVVPPTAPLARPTAVAGTTSPGDERPWPQPRSQADASIAAVDDWEVDGVLRRGRLLVVAGPEGLGKSHARLEIAIRKATGHGALFNHYRIPHAGRVLSFDVENGEEEETRREEETLARLGLTRADLADYWGVSLEGLSLTDPHDQAYIRTSIEQASPAVVMFDTGSTMIGDEWGKELKAAIRFLRGLARQYACAIVVFVHLVKPAKVPAAAKARGKPEPNSQHGTSLVDVMGQWTRQADTVALMADAGAGRVLWTVRKRAPHSQLVLHAEGGTFDVVQVVGGEDLGVSTMERIHGCIATGYADAAAIATYLELSERTVWRHIARLRDAGRVEPDGPLRVSVPVSVGVSAPVSRSARTNGAHPSGAVSAMSADRTDTVTTPVGGDVVSVSVRDVSAEALTFGGPDDLDEPEDIDPAPDDDGAFFGAVRYPADTLQGAPA